MRCRVLLIVLTVFALVGCGDIPARVEITPPPTVASTSTSTTTTSSTTTTTATTTTTTTTTVPRTTTTTTTTTTVAPVVVHASDDYHQWWDWYVWRAIGRCEQGGYAPEGDGIAWHGQAIGGSAGSGYPGGLGIMAEAWTESMAAAGVTVSNGAYASPADQIRIARVIRARAGLHAWACGRKLFPSAR